MFRGWHIPSFWFTNESSFAPYILSPFGFVYGGVTSFRMGLTPKTKISKPVICVGNFVIGGAGKTPVCLAIAGISQSLDLRPAFLSRGYGGKLNKQPTIVSPDHTALDVGDEALLLSEVAPTCVCSDRSLGAIFLENNNDIDLVIMDDGFQSPSVHKDYSFIVDSDIGNGFCFPAGALRAPIRSQLPHCSALISFSDSLSFSGTPKKPVLSARLTPNNPDVFSGKKVLAYCGISNPEKFYNTLEDCGVTIAVYRSYADHHFFTDSECADLLSHSGDYTLVTTSKDSVRLRNMGEAQHSLWESSNVLDVSVEFEDEKKIESIIRSITNSS